MPRKQYAKRIKESLQSSAIDPFRSEEKFSDPEAHNGEDLEILVDDLFAADDRNVVKRAFKDANLDFRNIFHWYYLLEHFATTHYKSKQSTRVRKRSDEDLKNLLKAVDEHQRSPPKKLQAKILKELQATRADLKLRNLSEGSMKALLSKARKLSNER
jgi:hypothetical protein